MTAGYDPAPSLGGNVHGWPRPQVNAWRAAYVQERARMGEAGFGEFNFRGGNSRSTGLPDVVSALAARLRSSASAASASSMRGELLQDSGRRPPKASSGRGAVAGLLNFTGD